MTAGFPSLHVSRTDHVVGNFRSVVRTPLLALLIAVHVHGQLLQFRGSFSPYWLKRKTNSIASHKRSNLSLDLRMQWTKCLPSTCMKVSPRPSKSFNALNCVSFISNYSVLKGNPIFTKTRPLLPVLPHS